MKKIWKLIVCTSYILIPFFCPFCLQSLKFKVALSFFFHEKRKEKKRKQFKKFLSVFVLSSTAANLGGPSGVAAVGCSVPARSISTGSVPGYIFCWCATFFTLSPLPLYYIVGWFLTPCFCQILINTTNPAIADIKSKLTTNATIFHARESIP